MNSMTEDEAKDKWCPFVRVVERHPDGVTGTRNRVAIVEGDTAAIASDALIGARCIGSACMAWRWEPAIVIPADSVTPEMLKRKGGGFCGLAGGPT